MKFTTLLLSLVLGTSLAFADAGKLKKKKRYRPRASHSTPAAVSDFSAGDVLRFIFMTDYMNDRLTNKIDVVAQRDDIGKDFVFESIGQSLAARLTEHVRIGDRVRYDKFACKAADQAGVLKCRLVVVENLKKGEKGLVSYGFKVARNAQGKISLLPPLNAALTGGTEVGANTAVMQYLYPNSHPAEFREFKD